MKIKSLLLFFLSFIFCFVNSLDKTFGIEKTGHVVASIQASTVLNAVIKNQDDGKIVLGGNSKDNLNFTLLRYDVNGIIDSSFGVDGIVTTVINSQSGIQDLIVQSDGKIIAAGYSSDVSNSYLTLVRYNTDGTLDTTFNGTGIVTTLVGTAASVQSIQVQSDDKIVVGGNAIISDVSNLVFARYNTDGSLDSSFGSSGVVTNLIGDFCLINSLAIQADGKIVGTGYTFMSEAYNGLIVRYNTDGTLDTGFNGTGIVTVLVGLNTQISSASIQTDQKIVIGGYSSSVSEAFVILRYNTDGSIDLSFGTDGIVTTQIQDNCRINALTIQSDDKIVAAGYSALGNIISSSIARYDTDGVLDTTFGSSGIITVLTGNESQLFSAAIQSDDKIIASGSTKNSITNLYDFLLLRYKKNNTVMTEPVYNSTLIRKIVFFGGNSTGVSSTVKVYLDGVLFSTTLTDGSGNWSTGNTTVLTEGLHSVRADLLDVSDNIIVSDVCNFTIDTSLVSQWASGNILRVDAIFGDDANGVRGGAPFMTVNAALAQSQSGDIVLLGPGTYNETITIPTGVIIRGTSPSTCIISRTGVTADTDLVTMGENSSIENVRLLLTSAQHHTLRGIVFPGTTSATARAVLCNIIVDNRTAGAGTSNVYGVHSTGTGQALIGQQAFVLCVATIFSIGSGNKRGLLVDAANNFNTLNSIISAVNVSGDGPAIGIETNHASANVLSHTTIINGNPSADISQTLGTITLAGSVLERISSNGNAFAVKEFPHAFIFADSGTVGATDTYLRPGTATSSATEIKVRISQAVIVKGLSVKLITSPGTGNSVVWTVRKNGVDTGITLTLSDAQTSGVFNTSAVNFAAGDDLSIKQAPSGANAAADIMAIVDFY